MSNEATKKMLPVYSQMSEEPTRFFSGMFQTPEVNYFNSQTVEIDIDREEEDIAIAVTDPTLGYRMNDDDEYTNKEVKPPAFKEAIVVNSDDLYKRKSGSNPFSDEGFRAMVIAKVMSRMTKVEKKIRRSMELAAAQVMTTGIVTLKDENGNTLVTIDYKPKATHFPTVATAWDAVGNDKLGDLLGIASVVRNDGLIDPVEFVFGETALQKFLEDSAVTQLLDTRRADRGTINQARKMGDGGVYHGSISIANYRFDIWGYGGRYKDPETGNKVQFMPPEKVLCKANGRLDYCFGNIPNIAKLLGANQTINIPELPSRFSMSDTGVDLHVNLWLTPDGEQLMAGIGSRPVPIPTAIDRFGCIDTGL